MIHAICMLLPSYGEIKIFKTTLVAIALYDARVTCMQKYLLVVVFC